MTEIKLPALLSRDLLHANNEIDDFKINLNVRSNNSYNLYLPTKNKNGYWYNDGRGITKWQKISNVYDNKFIVNNSDDITKSMKFDISNVSSDTIRTLTMADDNIDLSDIKINTDFISLLPTELQNLTNIEVQQLQNIDTTTISNTQWGYLGSMNQNVATTDSVSFSGNSLITTGFSDNVGLIVKGVLNQSEDLQQWQDSDGNTLSRINDNGRIYSSNGIGSAALYCGSSLTLYKNGGPEIEHTFTSHSANYDFTGGTYESWMYDVDGEFVSTDIENWVVVRTGDYIGAMAKIDNVIDSQNATLHTMGWDFDITGFGYLIIKHPQVVFGDNYHNLIHMNNIGHFDIFSNSAWVGFNNDNSMLNLKFNAGKSEIRCQKIDINCRGYSNVVGEEISFKSGDLGPGESVAGVYSHSDISDALSADNTTSIPCYIAGVSSGSSNATSKAYLALSGFTTAFQVYGAAELNPDYGYEITSGVVVDRVNGSTADGTAFLESSASNLPIMDNNLDYILIGSDNQFELININLSIFSNKNCKSKFYYSKTGGNWTQLTVNIIDSTDGLRQNGMINFNKPVDWTKDYEAEIDGDITNAYYMKIERNEQKNIDTLPTENFFKIRQSKEDGMKIRGDGTISPALMADSTVPNNSIYYSLDSGSLSYKDPTGNVNSLY